MISRLVRFCGRFTLIIGLLTTISAIILTFVEEAKIPMIFTVLFFINMTVTGWFARNYGLDKHVVNSIVRLCSFLSLIFGILLVIVMPILFLELSGFEDSALAIRNVTVLFIPMVVSALAIILTKKGKDKS